jgi:hypothetical protein
MTIYIYPELGHRMHGYIYIYIICLTEQIHASASCGLTEVWSWEN